MTKLQIGIVDYDLGNHASIYHNLKSLGFRCQVSDDQTSLKACDLIVLPGVGSFKPAMKAIKKKRLDYLLQTEAARNKPILGICLGMQLLGESSEENGLTPGLGLVPGNVKKLEGGFWHIGWNSVSLKEQDPFFDGSENKNFYFNHSCAYETSEEFVVCTTVISGKRYPSAVRFGRVVGIQFHPEKSQSAGKELFKSVIEGLCNA